MFVQNVLTTVTQLMPAAILRHPIGSGQPAANMSVNTTKSANFCAVPRFLERPADDPQRDQDLQDNSHSRSSAVTAAAQQLICSAHRRKSQSSQPFARIRVRTYTTSMGNMVACLDGPSDAASGGAVKRATKRAPTIELPSYSIISIDKEKPDALAGEKWAQVSRNQFILLWARSHFSFVFHSIQYCSLDLCHIPYAAASPRHVTHPIHTHRRCARRLTRHKYPTVCSCSTTRRLASRKATPRWEHFLFASATLTASQLSIRLSKHNRPISLVLVRVEIT